MEVKFMRTSYSEIKGKAKSAMNGHIGEVILVGLILPIAFSMIGNFLNGIFGLAHWSIPTFLSLFTNAVATYITLRMVLKIVRFNPDKIFIKFFGTQKGILNSLGFALFTVLISAGYIIIFWDYFALLWDLMRIMPADYFVSDPEALENWANDQVIKDPSILLFMISGIYSLIVIIVTVRLSFTQYIIADSDLDFIEAMKKSWKISKGNWWRIVFFPLSFILWLLLSVFTIGIALIYVIPYMTIAHGAFYDELLIESGEVIESGFKKPTVNIPLTDENALDEDKNEFDKSDPFENYYE
jgi:uncharacterized membrane protein